MPAQLNHRARLELLDAIRHVRSRWRMRIALRGLAALLGVGLVAFLVSSWGMEGSRFSPAVVNGFRILTWVSLLAVGFWCLVRPLWRRPSDAQVALYLEEHEPSLKAAVLSAVDAGADPGAKGAAQSPALVRGLMESAVEKARAVDGGHRIERAALFRWTAAVAGIGLATLIIFLTGPAFLRHGASVLLSPAASAAEVNPYSIEVSPGDVTITRGSDQRISARNLGFDATEADLFVRTGSEGEFRPLSMLAADETGEDDAAEFEIVLFGVDDVTEYFVRSSGVQSDLHRIDVEILPYVDRLELVYEFPAYTGLPDRTVDEGGDIAVLRGTRVHLRAFPTIPSPRANLWRDDALAGELAPAEDGSFAGSFVVERNGFYRIEMESARAGLVPASPQYTIDVLNDQPPGLSFTRPGRDESANALEEFFVEARANDDYGIREMELVFSVNGGEEQTVELFGAGAAPMSEVSAGYTFFLEEYELVPGDIISYYAKARDNAGTGSQEAISDIYFLQIRRFETDFRQAEQQPGGGGGGGGAGAGNEQELSEQQREVISATFNLNRDRARYSPEGFNEGLVVVRLSQERLRDQVATLVTRLNNRGVVRDPEFEQIAELLPRAMEEMEAAMDRLDAADPGGALSEEQQALQYLLRAEALYDEVQVSQQQGGGGGGGGGRGPSAEDLADLFELELDKLKNQYESVQRGERQQADEQIDETLERLRELARRQEQEAERRQRLANRSQGSAGGGSQNQRSLADEVEEEARRLEQLSRMQSNQRLAETARQLQDAANAMREAAAGRGNEGAADARSALDRLRAARRLLERDQSGRVERDAQDALRRSEQLIEEQLEVAGESVDISGSDQVTSERMRRLIERKNEMFQEVADLERQIDQMSADASSEQEQAAESFDEALRNIRDNKIKERIQYSRGLPGARSPDFTRDFEQQTTDHLMELRDQLRQASEAVGEPVDDRTMESLDRARDMVRNMESLNQRLQARADENARRGLGERPGEEAQGQQGQGRQEGEGQQGQQGQSGQQGEGGQQGQGQQGQGGRQGQGGQRGGQPGGPGGPANLREFSGAGFGPGGSGWARGLTPEDIRQFQGEYRERAREMADLREQLSDAGVGVEELDDVIGAMRALDDRRVYDDMEEILRLQTQILEGVKRFEFGLRRAAGEGDSERLLLSGSDEVPQGFRQLIEEYYRSLSRSPGG